MSGIILTKTDFEFVGENKTIKSKCNAINFFVPSTGHTVYINGRAIPPGGSLSINQPTDNMVDMTQYEAVFGTDGTTAQLEVTRILRVDVQQLD